MPSCWTPLGSDSHGFTAFAIKANGDLWSKDTGDNIRRQSTVDGSVLETVDLDGVNLGPTVSALFAVGDDLLMGGTDLDGDSVIANVDGTILLNYGHAGDPGIGNVLGAAYSPTMDKVYVGRFYPLTDPDEVWRYDPDMTGAELVWTAGTGEIILAGSSTNISVAGDGSIWWLTQTTGPVYRVMRADESGTTEAVITGTSPDDFTLAPNPTSPSTMMLNEDAEFTSALVQSVPTCDNINRGFTAQAVAQDQSWAIVYLIDEDTSTGTFAQILNLVAAGWRTGRVHWPSP